MTKLEQAIKEAELLPFEARERLGEDLLHYIHRYLALREDPDAVVIRHVPLSGVLDG